MLAWSAALTWALANAQEASSLYNNEHISTTADTVPPNNFFYVHGSSVRFPRGDATPEDTTFDYRLQINNGDSPNLAMLRGERYRFLVADNVGEILEQRSALRHYGFHLWSAERDANNVASCSAGAQTLRTSQAGVDSTNAGAPTLTIQVKPAANLAALPLANVGAPDGATTTFGPHVLECNELAWRADVGFAIGQLIIVDVASTDLLFGNGLSTSAIIRTLGANGFALGDVVHIQQSPGPVGAQFAGGTTITTAVVVGAITSNPPTAGVGTQAVPTQTNLGNLVVKWLSGAPFARNSFEANFVRVFKSNRGDSFNPVYDLRSSNPLLLEFQLHTQNTNGMFADDDGYDAPSSSRASFQNLLCYNRRGFSTTRRAADIQQLQTTGDSILNLNTNDFPAAVNPFAPPVDFPHPWVGQRNDVFPYGAPFERTGWQEVTIAVPSGTVPGTGGLAPDTDLCYGMCNLYETTMWPNPASLTAPESGFAAGVRCFGVGHISVVDFSEETGPALVRTMRIRGSTVQLHPAIVTGVDPNDPSGDVYGDHTVQPALPRNQVALPYVYQPISTVIPVEIPTAGTVTTNADVGIELSGRNLDTTTAEFRLYPCNPVLPPCANGATDKAECQDGRPANRNPTNFGDRLLNGYPSFPKTTAGRNFGGPNLAQGLQALRPLYDPDLLPGSHRPATSAAGLGGVNVFGIPGAEDVFFPFNNCGQPNTVGSPWGRCPTPTSVTATDERWYQWNSAPTAAWPAFDAQLASTVCTCETARSQAAILHRTAEGRLVTSGRIPASADQTETSATLTLPGSLLDNALTMNGARASGREGDFILCPTVPFIDSRSGAETITPGGQGLILQLRTSCASDQACIDRSSTAACENSFDRDACRLATQCRDVGGSQGVCVVPEYQDVCGTNLYNKVEGRCCDPANSLVYPSDVWGIDEADFSPDSTYKDVYENPAAGNVNFGSAFAATALETPLIGTDFWLDGMFWLSDESFGPFGPLEAGGGVLLPSFGSLGGRYGGLQCASRPFQTAINVFTGPDDNRYQIGAPRSLLEYQMCTFVDAQVTKGWQQGQAATTVLAARWRKQVQQVQGRPRFPCPCTAANYPGDSASASSALGSQTYGCALENEQCCTFNSAGWRNNAAATLEANPLFLSLDYYQCYDSTYWGCCDDGQIYNPGLERCCALTGIQPSEVPCPCAADDDCKIPNRADKDADMFCCTQSAPRPAFYDESVATCSRFQNWEPVEDYFGIVGAGIKHHAHPTIEKLRRAEENHLFAFSTDPLLAQNNAVQQDLSSRYGRYGRTHAAPTCPGVCIDTSYQTCCNGNVCGSQYETCCNSTCCNKFSATCVESRNLPKDHLSWVDRFLGKDIEFGIENNLATTDFNDIAPSAFRFQAFEPFRGFLGTLRSGSHPAWFASSVNYGNTYDVCTTVEYLNPIRAVAVFVVPTALLLMSVGILLLASVFALRQADRSYFLTEKILVVLAVALAFFTWPLFFSPQFKYGIIAMAAAASTIAAAGARIKYTHVVMAVVYVVLVLFLLDPFSGSELFNLTSWKDAATGFADFRANGIHRHITTNWLPDTAWGAEYPFPNTGAPVIDQRFKIRTIGEDEGGPDGTGLITAILPATFVDDNADRASSGVQAGLPVFYKFDHAAQKLGSEPLASAAGYAFNNICTAFYSGYFQLDARLLDHERYDNYQERFFGYCSRGWTVTLLVTAGFVVMLSILILLFTLFEIGILIQWQRDGEWNFDPEEADMFRARDKIADVGPEEAVPAVYE